MGAIHTTTAGTTIIRMRIIIRRAIVTATTGGIIRTVGLTTRVGAITAGGITASTGADITIAGTKVFRTGKSEGWRKRAGPQCFRPGLTGASGASSKPSMLSSISDAGIAYVPFSHRAKSTSAHRFEQKGLNFASRDLAQTGHFGLTPPRPPDRRRRFPG
jgi:hypothetical protein